MSFKSWHDVFVGVFVNNNRAHFQESNTKVNIKIRNRLVARNPT